MGRRALVIIYFGLALTYFITPPPIAPPPDIAPVVQNGPFCTEFVTDIALLTPLIVTTGPLWRAGWRKIAKEGPFSIKNIPPAGKNF